MPKSYTAINNADAAIDSVHFYPKRTFLSDAFWIRFLWGNGSGTVDVGSVSYPQGVTSKGINFNSSATYGTLRVEITRNTLYGEDLQHDLGALGKVVQDLPPTEISYGDKVIATFCDVIKVSFDPFTIYLPKIRGTFGTTMLWVSEHGETYYDSAYATVACGSVSHRTVTDTMTMTDSKHRNDRWAQDDYLAITEGFRYNPRRYPVEKMPITDNVQYTSVRHGTITDWQFKPSYVVLFDVDNNGTFGTTIWDRQVIDYSNIRKSIKHWSGDIEVGNWTPQLADPYNELYGSMYTGGLEARMRNVMLSALINDTPNIFIPQF